MSKYERYVHESNIAYHAGNWLINQDSIGIEHVNSTLGPDWKVSDNTFQNSVRLSRYIAERNGLLPLRVGVNLTLSGHKDHSSTACPGWLYTQLQRYADAVNNYKGDVSGVANEIKDNLSPFFTAGRPRGIKRIVIHHGATRTFSVIGSTFKTKGVSATYGVNDTDPGSTPAPAPKPSQKSNDTIATEVMSGAWGNMPQRKTNLERAGYNYDAIQSIINARYGIGKPAPTQPSAAPITTIARQVIAGAFGNNPQREANLRRAGHDPAAVQREVNRLLGVGSTPNAPQGGIFAVGQRVTVANPIDVNGTRLGTSGVYDVMQVNGNRIVIGRGGAVTAAINSSNLRRA